MTERNKNLLKTCELFKTNTPFCNTEVKPKEELDMPHENLFNEIFSKSCCGILKAARILYFLKKWQNFCKKRLNLYKDA